MYEQPGHPPWEAAQSQPPRRDDRAAPRDVRGRAQVAVLERLRHAPGVGPLALAAGPLGLAGQLAPDPAARVEPGLHRDLGDPRQLAQAHHVADHGDLGVSGDGQIVLNHDPPRPVSLRTGRPRQRGGELTGLHPGGPQHGPGLVPRLVAVAVTGDQAVPVDVRHDRFHVQLDAQFTQGIRGLARQLVAESRQRLRPGVE